MFRKAEQEPTPERDAIERAGRAAERFDILEAVPHVQHQILEEASRRPYNRDDLVDRLRYEEF